MVKRYDLHFNQYTLCTSMAEREKGDYVRHDDYAALEKQHEETIDFLGKDYKFKTERLEAENKRLESRIRTLEGRIDDARETDYSRSLS